LETRPKRAASRAPVEDHRPIGDSKKACGRASRRRDNLAMQAATGLEHAPLSEVLEVWTVAWDTHFGLTQLAPSEDREIMLERLRWTIDCHREEIARRARLALQISDLTGPWWG
jgi:hypothetical protein